MRVHDFEAGKPAGVEFLEFQYIPKSLEVKRAIGVTHGGSPIEWDHAGLAYYRGTMFRFEKYDIVRRS